MTRRWWPLVLVAVLNLTAATGAAIAQTAILMNAPPATPAELVVNSATVATGTTDQLGDVTLSAPPGTWKEPAGSAIYVQTCPSVVRVRIVAGGLAPPPTQLTCELTPIQGTYWMQNITSVVIDLGGSLPSLRIRQGSAPAAWLSRDPARLAPETGAGLAGLVLFGGGGFGRFRDAVDVACGSGAGIQCEGGGTKRGWNGGVAYWFVPFIGAEAAILKPSTLDVAGTGDGFRFDTALETQIVTLAGNVGIPVGRVRLFGQAGATYHQATSTTTQTIEPRTLTLADGTTVTVPGGTQEFELETRGWGPLYGGGLEVWANGRLGFYGQLRLITVKGTNRTGGEGAIDDRLLSIGFGVRVRIAP